MRQSSFIAIRATDSLTIRGICRTENRDRFTLDYLRYYAARNLYFWPVNETVELTNSFRFDPDSSW